MNLYETLTGRHLETARFTPKEKRALSELLEKHAESPEWANFSDAWQKVLGPLLETVPRAERTKHPLYVIAQDLEMRLGIAQGQVAAPDYRDFIVDRIEERFGSRYRFCQETEIPQAFLSQVLSGKKDFSIETLRRVAKALDLSLALLPASELAAMPSSDGAALTKASALITNELTVLKNAHDHLKRIKDPSKRRKAVENERTLFEGVLERVAGRLGKLKDEQFGEEVLKALKAEIERLDSLLAGLRDQIAKVAESGSLTSRGGEPHVDRASLSRV